MKKHGLHTVRLLTAPFSNQEGEWLWTDEEFRDLLSSSKIYFIGQREQVLFDDIRCDQSTLKFTVNLKTESNIIENVSFNISDIVIPTTHEYFIEAGPNHIRIRHGKGGSEIEWPVCFWCTPDRLMYYHWKGQFEVKNLEDFMKFTTFSLYYVGISKKGDSFSRLFNTAHEERSRILGNETQFKPVARLTDELMIFICQVEDLNLASYEPTDSFEDFAALGKNIDPATLASDAEKSFVKMLQTKYNRQKYAAFPKSTDGLWPQKWDKYGYAIEEPITFISGANEYRGGRLFNNDPWRPADIISVVQEDVEIIRFNK